MIATISIINYNYGKFLSDAIESALNQDTKFDYEVLLIDDGSTDNSDDVAKRYLHFNNVRISKSSNQGFAKSLNRAILEAKGEYVFLMDADDSFLSNKLSLILPILQQGFLYVSDTSQYINESGEKIDGGLPGSTSTVAVNRAAALELLPIENEIYLFSLLKLGRGKAVNRICTNYRLHNNSMTDRSIPGKWQSYLAMVTHKLANKLFTISEQSLPNIWKVKKKDIYKVGCFFESRAYYNELEACLELSQWRMAIKKYRLMIIWSLKYKKVIYLFHIKMFVRLLLLKPSFPKQKSL